MNFVQYCVTFGSIQFNEFKDYVKRIERCFEYCRLFADDLLELNLSQSTFFLKNYVPFGNNVY